MATELTDWMSQVSTAPFDYSQMVSMISPLAANPQTAPMANTILAQMKADLDGWQKAVQDAAATSTGAGGAFDQQVYNKLLQQKQAILGRAQQMEQFLTPYLQQQSLQNQTIAEQAREFNIGTGEGARQFDLQQALKQQASDRAYQMQQAQQNMAEAQMRAEAWKSSMAGLSAPWSGNIFDPQMQAMYEAKFKAGDQANATPWTEQWNQGGGGGGAQGKAGAPGQQVAMGGGSSTNQEGPVLWGDYAKNLGGSFINQQAPQNAAPQQSFMGGYDPNTQQWVSPSGTQTQPGLDPNWQNATQGASQGGAVSSPQGGFDFSGGFSSQGSGGNMAGIGLVKDPGSFMSNFNSAPSNYSM
jgi:hypothetical protein